MPIAIEPVEKNLQLISMQVIRQYDMDSIDCIVEKLHLFMCHIDQEPAEFGTYRNTKDSDERKEYNKIKDQISLYGVGDYLDQAMESSSERLPANCKTFALVAGTLAKVLYPNHEVYRLGRVRPAYVRGVDRSLQKKRQRPKKLTSGKRNTFPHYLNAIREHHQYRFFDASVYRNVFFIEDNCWQALDSAKARGFDPANIDFEEFIDWVHLSQRSPRRRLISTTSLGKRYCPSSRRHDPKEYLLKFVLKE